MTDLKAWSVPLPPRRRWRGRTVRVHAGFIKAWTQNGFSKKVLDRVKEIEALPGRASGVPLRFWVTGHSLGGALAVLASHALHSEFPGSTITCYTFGCPRVRAGGWGEGGQGLANACKSHL